MLKKMILSILTILSLEAQQTPQEGIEALVRSQNAFGLNLFKEISPGYHQNMCLSPYSVSAVLSMTLSGAKGNTQKQISQTLNLTIAPEKIDEAFSKLNQQLFSRASETSNELRLIQANSLWVQSGLPINPEFATSMEEYYRGAFRKADFVDMAETARSDINNWIREKTLGQIPLLFEKGDINANTRMVLANTLYLKARWAKPFNKQLTHQELFFTEDGSILSVLSMVDTDEYFYLDTSNFSMIKIPYVTQRTQNEQLAMLILLPHTREKIESIVNELSPGVLQTWLLGMKSQNIQLLLPKFQTESTFDLNQPLMKLGIVEAFTDKADFSSISTAPLKIGVVKQKTMIDVDEDGTEAVAATGASMVRRMMMGSSPPMVFKVDHPFVYIIYDQATGAILFIGKVYNPNV